MLLGSQNLSFGVKQGACRFQNQLLGRFNTFLVSKETTGWSHFSSTKPVALKPTQSPHFVQVTMTSGAPMMMMPFLGGNLNMQHAPMMFMGMPNNFG